MQGSHRGLSQIVKTYQLGKPHDVPFDTCPRCGTVFNASSGIGYSGPPSPGDFTLCIECGEVLRLDAKLRRVLATDADLAELRSNPASWLLVRRAQEAIRELSAERKLGER